MRRLLLCAAVLAPSAAACPLCHSSTGDQVRAAILGPSLWTNLAATLLPFTIFAAIAITAAPRARTPRRPLITAGIVLGLGMGGFVDGILFHQILQLHNMLSAKLPPTTLVNVETNMVWDGLFHALTWLMTAIGIALLWHAGKQRRTPWSGRILLGGIILGWGVFNLVEGLIDHHLLNLHHVVERLGPSLYDYAFLASGLLFILLGYTLIATAEHNV